MDNEKVVDRIVVDATVVRSTYDRELFGFSHTLHQSPLFISIRSVRLRIATRLTTISSPRARSHQPRAFMTSIMGC